MRLLVDTTYLLPAVGIAVKGLPADGTIRLMQKGHQIHASDISIFELAAKGAKHIATGELSPERVARGVRAIVHDGMLTMIPIHESTLLLTAFKLGTFLSDFIDCLIVASAINHCDALITEDEDIVALKEDRGFGAVCTRVNPRFGIQTLTEVS